MEDVMMCPAAPTEELCTCDRETFERVWKRVMNAGGEAPIQTDPPADEQARQMRACGQDMGLAMARREDGGQEQDVCCLGQGSAVYAPTLQEMMDGAMEDFRTYQTLTRRAGGSGARILGAMAADQRRQVKRLGAAYFLITGERYQPPMTGGNRGTMDLMSGLREQFIREQRMAAAYQGAAQEAGDPCLRRLFRELGQEDLGHARMIRSLLEQM